MHSMFQNFPAQVTDKRNMK